MASSASDSAELTPAQKMAAMHDQDHQPSVEEVVDEDDKKHPSTFDDTPAASTPEPQSAPAAEPLSAKAAGKQKAAAETPSTAPAQGKASAIPNIQDADAFPSLGAPKIQPQAASWGSRPSAINGTKPRAAPAATTAPAVTGYGQPRNVSLPGTVKDSFTLLQSQMKPRSELRKPLPDIIRDINRGSRAKVEMRSAGNSIIFLGSGPTQESVREALKEVVNQVGAKQTLKIPIPASVRPHIIGKGGSVIQGISKRTGARVQLPKATGPESEDDVVEVEIEGNPIATQYARVQIESIVNERTASLSQRLRHIPAEFYPFIAGPHNTGVNALEDGKDVRVKVPHYYTWSSQQPPVHSSGSPLSFTPQDGPHILLSGDRDAVRQVQEEIERQVADLQRQLTLNRLAVERERHRFILGQAGQELHNFLQETGCSIILPPSHDPDNEDIVIIGPPDQIDDAINKVMELASSMQMATVDVARQHPNASRGAQIHARDVTRYLQQRKALAEFETLYNAQVVTPGQGDSYAPWQVYARDGKDAMKARADLLSLISGHPPARFRSVDLHPYFQEELDQSHAQHLRDQFGVHLIASTDGEDSPLLLVYEGQGPTSSYRFPRSRPSEADLTEFEQALAGAEEFVQALVQGQSEVVQRSVDAPTKYREKIQKLAARERQREPRPAYPIQFVDGEPVTQETNSSRGSYPVQFRGPMDVAEAFEATLKAFIEEQVRDEAERGYVTTLDFPQKYANLLIGRRGENINKLRDEFDVEIEVADDKVSIQGPQAKAERAKSHIASMLRKFEDEATHRLKIKPQFHRELVGAKGSTVLRLQDRYGVRITFPRNNAAGDDQSVADKGPSQAPDEVIIKGPSRGADGARDELLSLYQYFQENSHAATVNVAQAMLPALIGQGGKELDALRLTTGATIDIPPREEVDSSGRVDIKLKGTKANVESARKLLEERSRAFDDTITRTMDIDAKHHQFLIGARGENLKRLMTEAGGAEDGRRLVQFPRAGSSEPNIVRFEGAQDVVEKLMAALQATVEQREKQVSEAIEVPPERHGKLIGRQGLIRRGLESEFEVEIAVPNQNSKGPERSMVKITGLPANVQRAKERVLELTKEQEGVTIQVPRRLHHSVVDSHPNFFRNLSSNYKVTVSHGGQQIPARPQAPAVRMNGGASMPLITDLDNDAAAVDVEKQHSWSVHDAAPAGDGDDSTIPWVLRGADAANVGKARELIEKAMTSAQSSALGLLILPDQKMHRLVIGPGGSTINKIRKQSGCQIQVPKNSGAVEPIEITGPREGVEQAKQLIIDVVAKGSQK